MSLIFDIYIRVSEVGAREGESFGSPDEQEAACRAFERTRLLIHDRDSKFTAAFDEVRRLHRRVDHVDSFAAEQQLCVATTHDQGKQPRRGTNTKGNQPRPIYGNAATA